MLKAKFKEECETLPRGASSARACRRWPKADLPSSALVPTSTRTRAVGRKSSSSSLMGQRRHVMTMRGVQGAREPVLRAGQRTRE